VELEAGVADGAIVGTVAARSLPCARRGRAGEPAGSASARRCCSHQATDLVVGAPASCSSRQRLPGRAGGPVTYVDVDLGGRP